MSDIHLESLLIKVPKYLNLVISLNCTLFSFIIVLSIVGFLEVVSNFVLLIYKYLFPTLI